MPGKNFREGKKNKRTKNGRGKKKGRGGRKEKNWRARRISSRSLPPHPLPFLPPLLFLLFLNRRGGKKKSEGGKERTRGRKNFLTSCLLTGPLPSLKSKSATKKNRNQGGRISYS